MNNYEFCAAYAASHLPEGGRMLDYGCGNGTIVDLARSKGLDAVGCDVFYEGGDTSSAVSSEKIGETIFRMEGDRIPFPDETFDLITNNQVLEHVPDLEVVVAELSRVLKPGGTVLCLFPDKGVWREGHCGVPFLHWFPKGSSFRVNYAHFARLLGIGYHKGNKAPRQWACEFCQWLDDWTHYRWYPEVAATFERHLSGPEHLEADWFKARYGRGNWPAEVRRLIARKWGHLTFAATKPTS